MTIKRNPFDSIIFSEVVCSLLIFPHIFRAQCEIRTIDRGMSDLYLFDAFVFAGGANNSIWYPISGRFCHRRVVGSSFDPLLFVYNSKVFLQVAA